MVNIRTKMYNLLAHDFICSIPIALTQIAIATPVIYFSTCLIGKQFIVAVILIFFKLKFLATSGLCNSILFDL